MVILNHKMMVVTKFDWMVQFAGGGNPQDMERCNIKVVEVRVVVVVDQ